MFFAFVGMAIVDDDVVNDSDLDQNESSEDQAILAGLQKRINECYLNSSNMNDNESDHKYDFVHKNEDSFEFEYICQIPFPNPFNQQNPNFTFPEHLPDIPTSQNKLLDERVQNMLDDYEVDLSSKQTEYSYKKDSYSLSRPLKKRLINICSNL